MSNHAVPHAASSLRDLARKAIDYPKLLTKEELIRLAEHVLKSGEHATPEEHEIAKKTLHNPEGMEGAEISKLGVRSLKDK